ncbi:GNAT family N-acetyltransferase [Cellulomonas aerilata]|uniref:ElaA protein n=1 Tax=Cellulomonas aerilata TaxID=515326 RepID=A0A512DCB8_9CELL|nr:GNAT family N-acetyltransferase [Cellulomonas aerilata]GEO34132.1 ElaA protein [Cellulomonas aerilata]
MTVVLHRSAVRTIDPLELYAILRLRVSVFVVEQACPYPELDGRDVEAGAELLWATDSGDVVATLRVLHDADGALRVGRVATAPAARSRGVAAELMRAALDRCAEIDPSAAVVLDAQAHLAPWYGRFGFTVDGDAFDEDDIPHVPMRREAQVAPGAPGATDGDPAHRARA